MKNNIYTVLDIGSSKVACAVFEIISKSDEIKILGFSTKYSIGIRAGVVENANEISNSIASVIYEAEKQASITTKKVVLNVSHPFIQSKLIITDSNFGGRQILPKDLKNISNKVVDSMNQFGNKVIQCSTVGYDVDIMKSITEPEYMFAKNLKSYHTVVSLPKNVILLFNKCLSNLHLKPVHYVPSSYASSLSLDLGDYSNFMVLDIGGGVSDVVVFSKAYSILWAGSIPLGGENITKDIAECFAVSYEVAEKLKILHGNLSNQCSYEYSSADNGLKQEAKGVDISMLNKIILARVEEIIEIVLSKIPKQYKMKTFFLCGGVAKTLNIAEFISTRFNIKTVSANPSHALSGIKESMKLDPSFSTILGLIHYNLRELNKNKSFSIKKIFGWMWENF